MFSSPTVALLRRPKMVAPPSAAAAVDRASRLAFVAWVLVFLNVMTYSGSILPIPSAVGKGLTQGSLVAALALAMMANRRLLIRPNIYLFLITLLALETLLTVLTTVHFRGTGYRSFRFVEFAFTLWLLTPFWGDRDMLFVRAHLRAMIIALGIVVVGLVVAPGTALGGGRLVGTIWATPPTQIAHYAAILIGMATVLWFCGKMQSRTVLLIALIAIPVLLLTRTRTALLGLIVGLVVSGLTLATSSARARRLFAIVGISTVVLAATASSAINNWLARGENSGQISNLSGRTDFWTNLLNYPRTPFQELFGFGLSNGFFEGRPVDSNWMMSYQDQGLFGIAVCAAILLFMVSRLFFETRRLNLALAAFLVAYCAVASYTEVGFTNPTSYTLDLALAASLLMTGNDRFKALLS